MSTRTDEIAISTAPVPSSDYRATLRRGYGVLFITLLVLGGLSTFARIDSAVTAPGAISVEANRKTVQHLEGGIVSEILVRDGDVVKAGDTIVRLDPTRSEASAELYRKQQAIAMALEARLQAQINVRETLVYPPEVLALAKDPTVGAALEDNQRQFDGRRRTFLSASAVLDLQVAQAQKDMSQAISDKTTALQQLASIDRELPPLRKLLEQGLVPLPRVLNLERQEQQMKGVASKADIDLLRARERVSEFETRRGQLRSEYAQEAATAVPDVRRTLSDLQQQLLLARDTLKRIDIFAPVTGTIQQLRIFTVGGVVKPGEPIVDVVPSSANLVVKARIQTVDIDRVRVGMPVEIRLPQFQRIQSEVMKGEVRTVSRDTMIDEASRQPYYAMEIYADRTTIPKEIDEKLVAGMSTDVIIPTGERTVLQYFFSPILNRLALALRER